MDTSSPSQPVWVFPREDEKWREQIIREFHIHPITAQILVSRGFKSLKDIHDYLYAKLPDLLEPNLFVDMHKAAARVVRALKENEQILIYGDNDVDGMTGTALLADFLRHVGGNVHFYIPCPSALRKEFYEDAFLYAKEHACTLLITVDCGITSAKEMQKLAKQGIDVIITDHHEPTDRMPSCVATLNPKLLNQTYPNRELTGVGVAFKLAHGVTNALLKQGTSLKKKIDLKIYLDLVALGTVADMGVLLDENRILVRYGLKQLQKTRRIGLLKLFTVCGVDRSEVGTAEIASKVGPRLNSLGRVVADPRKGVELLLARQEQEAETLASELDLFNIERQKVEQVVSADVEQTLVAHPEVFKNRALVLSSNNWHPGVIPIIASRIAKFYNRPTILIAIDNGIGKGSIRTIREFPLLPALKKCSDLLINYGGHDYAAGLTIKEENIEKLSKRFIHAANSSLREQDLISKLYLDAPANFSELTYDLLSSLELFEPYGNENSQPVLYCEAIQAWPPKVIGGAHLKLYLEQKDLGQNDRMLEGIAFGMADRRPQIRRKNLKLRIAYTPQINRFHNKSSIQLLIRDFQVID